jgi:predicted ester cyclase
LSRALRRVSLKGPVVSIIENKAVVERFGEMVDGGDLSQLDALCAPDVINHALAPGRPNGIEGTREFLSSPGRQAHAGRWVERVVVAERDYVIEYGVRAGNWPAGTFRGFYIPAGHYKRDVAFMYRLHHRRIAERWAVRDDLGLMLQLGAVIPTPDSA